MAALSAGTFMAGVATGEADRNSRTAAAWDLSRLAGMSSANVHEHLATVPDGRPPTFPDADRWYRWLRISRSYDGFWSQSPDIDSRPATKERIIESHE